MLFFQQFAVIFDFHTQSHCLVRKQKRSQLIESCVCVQISFRVPNCGTSVFIISSFFSPDTSMISRVGRRADKSHRLSSWTEIFSRPITPTTGYCMQGPRTRFVVLLFNKLADCEATAPKFFILRYVHGNSWSPPKLFLFPDFTDYLLYVCRSPNRIL